MNHFAENGKEYLRKEQDELRQYRSNQGRSPEQQEANYKMMLISIIGLVVTMILAAIFN